MVVVCNFDGFLIFVFIFYFIFYIFINLILLESAELQNVIIKLYDF